MNTFRLTAAILFSFGILSLTSCVGSDAPEGEEPASLALEPSADEDGAASTSGDYVTECQPGSYLGPCAEWGANAFEDAQCGRGLHAWQYARCKQYRDSAGNYYYQECGGYEIWCDFTPQPWGTNDCHQSC